jgi:glycerol-3-phosphate dehydrogenase
VAQNSVDLVFRKLGVKPPPCFTAFEPVDGGRIERFHQFLDEIVNDRPALLNEEVMRHLGRNYGSSYEDILGLAEQNPQLVGTIGKSNVILAEIVHGVREEMAQKLSDVVLRRTDLGTGEFPGDKALQTCAELIATELKWNDERIQKEIDEVRALFPRWSYGQIDPQNEQYLFQKTRSNN